MARLRQRELRAFSQALSTLYADTSVDTLPTRILTSLRSLFASDLATFAYMDLRRGIWHTSVLAPVLTEWPGVEVHQRHLREDPAAVHIMKTRDSSALKLSDFVSLRQLRSLGVYREVFGRVGCDRRLGMAAHNGAPVTLVTTLNRQGRDFSEEDRALLNLLRPHLLQANDQAYASHLARAARERERINAGDAFDAGLGEIEDGRLLWLTPRGENLLKNFFPGRQSYSSPGRLPGEMAKRFAHALQPRANRSGDGLPQLRRLVWQFTGPDQRRLNVRLTAAGPERWQIFLEEAGAVAPARALSAALKLTVRQAEILHWLKQGKTNWEIGTILGISEKTAGKHLENIYARLNVENRTAAVHLAIETGADF